jgi:hypothetical protein
MNFECHGLNDQIPETCFENQRLARVVDSRVAWENPEGVESNCPDSYCLPISQSEKLSLDWSKTRCFKIERYGGVGIGVNGGGARCSLIDGFSIKGTGPNVLRGQGAPYLHSYGGASLKEAIRETIWGEILNVTLPFGAVRVERISLTGSEVPLDYPDEFGNSMIARALIYRKQFIRPAHFLRALSYRPIENVDANRKKDRQRTIDCLKGFETIVCKSISLRGKFDFVQLLAVLFQRYASQIAASRASRLLHGSISPSNLTIDGRVLDFGMSSSVADFGNYILARGCPSSSNQAADLIISLKELCWEVGAMQGASPSDLFSIEKDLAKHFYNAHDFEYKKRLLSLTGLNQEAYGEGEHPEHEELAELLLELSVGGNNVPFKILSPCENYRPVFLPQTGKYNLALILVVLICCSSESDACENLEAFIESRALREKLVRCYFLFYWKTTQSLQSDATTRRKRRLIWNCLRLVTTHPSLFAPNLNTFIHKELNESTEIDQLIDRFLAPLLDHFYDRNDEFLFVRIGELVVNKAQFLNDSPSVDVLLLAAKAEGQRIQNGQG